MSTTEIKRFRVDLVRAVIEAADGTFEWFLAGCGGAGFGARGQGFGRGHGRLDDFESGVVEYLFRVLPVCFC